MFTTLQSGRATSLDVICVFLEHDRAEDALTGIKTTRPTTPEPKMQIASQLERQS